MGELRLTDQRIAEEARGSARSRGDAIRAFRDRFVERLRRALEVRGAMPIRGGAGILEELRAVGHGVAIATGAGFRGADAFLRLFEAAEVP